MALLDTTVLIDLSRRHSSQLRQRAVRRIQQLREAGDLLYTSRINEAEFRVGLYRTKTPSVELARIEGVLGRLIILDFDGPAAHQFARTHASLLDRGLPAGEIDTLVAAIAIVNGQSLVTRNPAHFEDIDGLAVVAY